jgi:nitrogenase molybdenum-iron protein NifN
VVPVNTPDFSGSLESGFAIAVEGIVKTLVPLREEGGTVPGRRQRQVNVLPGSAMTPGDIEALRELLEAFELRPLFIPDISDSLGYLPENDFNQLTAGGTPVSEVALAGDSIATIAVGPSMYKAGELLQTRTGVPLYKFDSLLGLEAMDEFVHAISKLAQRPVPLRIERQRAQLQDAMLDAHFMLGFARIGLAAEPDELLAMSRLLQGIGSEVVAAVTSTRGPALKACEIAQVKIGDLEDLEKRAADNKAQLLIGNSHVVATAERLGLPMLHYGLPQYDLVGGYARTWLGYRGSRQALFDLANLMLQHHAGHEIKPYYSTLSPKREVVA